MSEVAAPTIVVRPRSRRRREVLPYLLVAPICLLMLAITAYPAAQAVYYAMSNATLLRLARSRFVWFENFAHLIHDATFLDGIWRTLRWDAAVVGLELALALPIALFLNRQFRGRGFLRTAMMIPYITPPAVVGLLFLYMFNGNFGVANDLLVRLGILSSSVDWFSDGTLSFVVIVLAMVWSGMPFMALVLLAALQTIPAELYEAADMDGAHRWAKFRHITLPHILPSVLFIVLLRLIWMSNHVDMIYVMTKGGPGFANYTEAVYSFTLTSQFNISYASAVAVLLAIVLMALSSLYVRHLARTTLAGISR